LTPGGSDPELIAQGLGTAEYENKNEYENENEYEYEYEAEGTPAKKRNSGWVSADKRCDGTSPT
jgi:hypothetical protein